MSFREMLKRNEMSVSKNVKEGIKEVLDEWNSIIREGKQAIVEEKQRRIQIMKCISEEKERKDMLNSFVGMSVEQFRNWSQYQRNAIQQIFAGGYTPHAIASHKAEIYRFNVVEQKYLDYYASENKIRELETNSKTLLNSIKLLEHNLKRNTIIARTEIDQEIVRLRYKEYDRLKWIYDNL